ncbi:MAG: M1 family peptidase [Desulfobacterales bacterium]|nr:M1 family peptidase [Desulfobacterales bacterium]MCF8078769.1 M1 family peptidase [Desulfobacterales bacterium]
MDEKLDMLGTESQRLGIHNEEADYIKTIRKKSEMRTLFSFLFSLFCFLLLPAAAPAQAVVEHDLVVRLEPEQHLLVGTDEISFSGKASVGLSFFLSPDAEIRRLTVNGKPADYRFHRNRVAVETPETPPGESLRLRVEYAAVFDDPYPETPANTDNPGFGVTGIVGGKGAFILSGAGWYPVFPAVSSRFSITVDAPQGMVAVTAGRSDGRRTEGGRTLSSWKVDQPLDGLSLSAGYYEVTEDDAGGIQVATYFTAETQPLSGRYIAAVKRYLSLYTELFGPYPFEKFAVVENFFPTGYGFASYTLMGGVVLRLPFIVDVSLGHEIAHCWWGNGVRVDYASGNWSEGLTTYVADYLYKEQESAEAAEETRRQWLRNYAVLVDEESDFPLSEFVSRKDRVTKVVGYDKSAMVFHMLRQILGEEVFWGALRDVFEEKRFQRASWEDFRIAFERRAGHGPCCTLEDFFAQWIYRAGAPQLALEDVVRKQTKGGWQVSGAVVQRQDRLFDLPATLAEKTGQGTLTQVVSLHGKKTPFVLRTASRPSEVVLDLHADVFRRLFPEEIPASVNAVKGAGSVSVVVSAGAGKAGTQTAQMLVRSLGLSRARIVSEVDFQPTVSEGGSVVYIGFPENPFLLTEARGPVALFSDRFSAGGRVFSEATDTFFGVFENPQTPGAVVGILYPVHSRFGPLVARKAAHYGKYSYLAFSAGQNAAKGIWPVTDSPLIVRWE